MREESSSSTQELSTWALPGKQAGTPRQHPPIASPDTQMLDPKAQPHSEYGQCTGDAQSRSQVDRVQGREPRVYRAARMGSTEGTTSPRAPRPLSIGLRLLLPLCPSVGYHKSSQYMVPLWPQEPEVRGATTSESLNNLIRAWWTQLTGEVGFGWHEHGF